MRKASTIIGIIGGVLAILVSLFAFGSGIMAKQFTPELFDEMDETLQQMDEEMGSDFEYSSEFDTDIDFSAFTNFAGNIILALGGALVLSGILGIVGGAIVKKNNVAAGIMMLIGAVITLFTVWGILSFLLLTLAGIFALVKDNSQPQEVPSEFQEY